MLILASASPRRHELLLQVDLPHLVKAADIDESRLPQEPGERYVQRLALGKARSVGAQHPEDCILAADTTVVLGDHILNKPGSVVEARHMLLALSGNTHHVHTGLAVLFRGQELSHVETTAVTFASISSSELDVYLASSDSLDKAGAYGIQGYAARWVTRVEGDFFNVVGLPLAATVQLLRRAASI